MLGSGPRALFHTGMCPSSVPLEENVGQGSGKLPLEARHTDAWVRAPKTCCRARILPFTTPTPQHTQAHTSYREGVFNFFGITVGQWPHQTHNQPFKLPHQLRLQVCNEVLVGRVGAGGEEMEEEGEEQLQR